MTKIDARLLSLPEGKLCISKNGKYIKYYISDGHTCTYLSKNQRELATQLSEKKYLELRRNLLISESRILNSKLSVSKKAELAMKNYLMDDNFTSLLPSSISAKASYSAWMNEPFPSNPNYAETLTIKTINGIMVRSKSEAMIAVCLYNKGIPFRYEMLHSISGIDFYPDFTIIKPSTGKEYIWEHFGKMDDLAYVGKFRNKISEYAQSDIIPGDNFIMTFETERHPLSIQTIEDIISLYLL